MEKLETRRKAKSYRNKSVLFILFGIILFFGVAINGLFIVLSIILFIIGLYLWKKQTTWNIGADGEESVIQVLQNLDSSFKIVNDIMLPGDSQNIDHIVIGPNGIFVIETKNHNGIIKCNNDEWSREKVGRRGTVYDASIGNPSKQAKRNAVMLKKWLESENIVVDYIDAVVVFTHEDVELDVNNPTIKVVHVDDLLNVFKGEPNFRMTNEKINSITNRLLKLK